MSDPDFAGQRQHRVAEIAAIALGALRVIDTHLGAARKSAA